MKKLLVASLALVPCALMAAGVADADITQITENATSTFTTVKTAGLVVLGAVILIAFGRKILKRFGIG